MKETPALGSVAEFFFNAPLYASFSITRNQLQAIYGKSRENIDGFCPQCQQMTPFVITGTTYSDYDTAPDGGLRGVNAIYSRELICLRRNHKMYFYTNVNGFTIQKIGQMPSLADIANDESKKYRSVLKSDSAREFHTAIGLAAHGVGIGAFVYFRRIFERLIDSRFKEFKDAEQWSEEEFRKLHMDQKVKFLGDHLPAFLVENSRIYSILSRGIHELEENECRKFFPVIKASIIVILDEDKKKKEELELRASLKQAISQLAPENKNNS